MQTPVQTLSQSVKSVRLQFQSVRSVELSEDLWVQTAVVNIGEKTEKQLSKRVISLEN